MRQENKVNTAKNEGYSDVYESCYICGRNMYKVKQIRVDENDNYICKRCVKENNIFTIPCADLNN